MPLFEYSCSSCGYVFERQLKVDDRNEPVENRCFICQNLSVSRDIGNNGGFRLGTKGAVSWAKGGYSTTYGDAIKHEAK